MKEETISEKRMSEAEYKEYKLNEYQRIVVDDKGTKYFINCKHFTYPRKLVTNNWWKFSMQIDTKYGSVNFQTVQWFNDNGKYSQNKIINVHKYFNWLWMKHGKPYYEVYKGKK